MCNPPARTNALALLSCVLSLCQRHTYQHPLLCDCWLPPGCPAAASDVGAALHFRGDVFVHTVCLKPPVATERKKEG